MARTKQEIRDFLNAQVGKRVNWKAGLFNGQCVSLIKALMEFLGVPNPYKARGHAKDAGDIYIREGIGKAGRGWLTVCVGKKGKYGHIWIDLMNEANYEQNLNGDLRTHKNTRPISQASQFVNFDQWVKADAKPIPNPVSNKTIYGSGYVKQADVIGRVSKFLRANFPAYTPKEALGNIAGSNFTKALKQFQSNCKITADGNFTIGGETWNKLKKDGFKG